MSKIEITNLNLHYGSFHALKNIKLAIHEKEITAFIGPSGCGKSTLLKSINRMNDLVEGCRIDGEILLDGANVYKDIEPSLLRKRVGMVFQKPNPFPMSMKAQRASSVFPEETRSAEISYPSAEMQTCMIWPQPRCMEMAAI